MAISSIEEIPTPRGLTRFQVENVDTPEQINTALNSVYDFAKDVSNYMEEQYQILHNGALIRSWQVEELLASTIGAGTIAVDKIYLGSDKFELDGALGQIRVKDDAGVVMLEFGEFAGVDWGIKVRNGSNAVVFQALSNAGVTMDGAIITNATIGGASLANGAVDSDQLATDSVTTTKILNASITGAKIDGGTITGANIVGATITGSLIDSQTIEGSNIANNTITDTQVGSLSATTINAGTLTVDGSPAISVVGSGAMVFENGGDSIYKASGAGDDNLIRLQNSSGTDKLLIGYGSTDDRGFLVGGTDMLISCTSGTVLLGLQGMEPLVDGVPELGTTSKRFGDGWFDDIHSAGGFTTGDIHFGGGEGVTMTEPNRVWKDGDVSDGIVVMSANWEVLYWDHANGDRQTKGLKKPTLQKGEFQDKRKKRRQHETRSKNG